MANAERHPQMCDLAAQRSSSAASFLKIVVRERVMGVNTDYLGHVEIVPNLNQAEYDYLHAFARSRRSYRSGGPYVSYPRTHTREAVSERSSATTRLLMDSRVTGASGRRARTAVAWSGTGTRSSTRVRLGCSTSLIIS
jgi:hypothetical protein